MRKTILRTLILTVLLFTLLSATAYEETATLTGDDVNLRSGRMVFGHGRRHPGLHVLQLPQRQRR